MPTLITSLQNPRLKEVVRLRDRGAREESGRMIIEGYRELKRALDNGVRPAALFYSPAWYLGENEPGLVARCGEAGAELLECAKEAFAKIAYRDRPEGLLALAPIAHRGLADLQLPERPLLIVAEAIEKPGNLGSILRSADAAGVHALVVCDRCTDVNNPNVVRASIGTLFTVPIAEATTAETLAWLKTNGIRSLAASPHAAKNYTEVDMTKPIAVVVGAEQFGLSDAWMTRADELVRIPMLGQADSLNVAMATIITLFEAVRQRSG